MSGGGKPARLLWTLAVAGALTAVGVATPATGSARVKGLLFFRANDGVRGGELWRTNGTRSGTRFVANINPGDDDGFPGPDGSFPGDFARLGKHVYFVADNGVKGRELWRTNGTRKGTRLVKDIDPGDDDMIPGPDSGSPSGFTKLGKRLYFGASDGEEGGELWRTDGTRKGTKQVKDIDPGSVGSAPSGFVRQGKRLFFRANDGDSGAEVWRTNGTRKGTRLHVDVNPGPPSSLPSEFASLGKKLIFRADDGVHGIEPWRTVGKTGAKLLRNISPGAANSAPIGLIRLGDRLYFGADDETRGRELWRTNGTRKGTKLVRDINPGDDDGLGGPDDSSPFYLARLGKRIYFSAGDDEHGRELWRTNGKRKGTKLVRDIRPAVPSSLPCELARVGRRLVFGAYTVADGFELWRSDGSKAGTGLVKDIRPGPIGSDPLGCD
jgi:ELWxxDGT repeat protein